MLCRQTQRQAIKRVVPHSKLQLTKILFFVCVMLAAGTQIPQNYQNVLYEEHAIAL